MRVTNKARKVNLFVVGMPKSGTTALFEYFKSHEDIFIAHKEPNFFAQELFNKMFDDEKLRNFFRSNYEEYIKKYKGATDEKYLADMTPQYLYSQEAAKNIYEYNPESKIIAILREPTSWMRSVHAYRYYGMRNTNKNFLEDVKLADEKAKRGETDPFTEYSGWLEYANHVSRYLKYFPADQVRIFIHEEFIKDNHKILDEIADFLEIRPFGSETYSKVNPSVKPRLSFLRKLVWKFPNQITFVKKVLPQKTFKGLSDLYVKITSKEAPKQGVPEEEILKLKRKYKSEVIKFEQLLKEYGYKDKDYILINLWGYDFD